MLCFTRERWRELVGQKGTRGLVSNDVVVLDDALVDRTPPRETHAKIWRLARRRAAR